MSPSPSPPPPPPPGLSAGPETADPLAVIIELLRPQTVLSKLVTGAGQWSKRYARYQDPVFCLILEGSCFLDVDGVGVVDLQAGDFAFLPETPAFTLASDLAMEPTTATPVPAREVHHGTRSGPPTMRMLGGYFKFDSANAPLLVRLLPPAIHIRREEPGAARLRRIVELIVEEAQMRSPGSELILERLVEVLIVEALRVRFAPATRQEHGLIAGLFDPGLARALRDLHSDVSRRWTVAELARIACMSRAVFAERFAQKVGMPPMQYLLEWRMALARDLLRRDGLPLAQVAERVGYQSASSFSAAFTRSTGCAPSVFARSTD